MTMSNVSGAGWRGGMQGSDRYCNFFFFSSRRRHTRFDCDWSSDVCSSDLTWTLEPLVKFVKEAGARLVLVMTSAGQVLAQHGFSRAVDVMSAAALGAAIM